MRVKKTNLGGAAASGRVLQQRSYAYRGDGTLVGVSDRLRGDRSFALDVRGQVTSVIGAGWVESYAYDSSGNLAAAVVPGRPESSEHEYDGTLLQRAGRSRFRYDAQGRLVGKTVTRLSRKSETWAYEWDAHDRLRVVVTPDGAWWRYGYDAFGPVSQSRRAVDQGAVDAESFAIVTDLVGAPTELIDPAEGAVVGHATTSLWGQSVWTGAGTPLRFPGQYFDDESGLHYNRYRYYAPDTARYLSLDPLGLAPSPNPSTYPHNPTGWTDPLGLAPCEPGKGTAPSSAGDLGTTLAPSDLSGSQASNFARYGSVLFSAEVLGRVPGSYVMYTKVVDSAGATTAYYKTTVAPDGLIVHVKIKFP